MTIYFRSTKLKIWAALLKNWTPVIFDFINNPKNTIFGIKRFIGHTLLSAYPNRIINLHPAYLPEFPGAHSIADAYEAKVAQTGVTVHFVDEGVDTGPIIRQERVAIDPSWDLETLESHVHAMEYDLFWQVIEQVAKSIEEEKEWSEH